MAPCAGTEWESLSTCAPRTRCVGPRRSAAHARPRTRRHASSAVGDAHGAPSFAAWRECRRGTCASTSASSCAVRKQTLCSQSRRLGAVSLVGGADERFATLDPAASVTRLVTASVARFAARGRRPPPRAGPRPRRPGARDEPPREVHRDTARGVAACGTAVQLQAGGDGESQGTKKVYFVNALHRKRGA